jgi:hypothetical protein
LTGNHFVFFFPLTMGLSWTFSDCVMSSPIYPTVILVGVQKLCASDLGHHQMNVPVGY